MDRENFESRLVDLFFEVFKEAIKHNRVKQMRTYGDYLYLLQGNLINPSIVDNVRILRQNFYNLSLDKYNNELKNKLDELFRESLEIKKEVYKNPPIKRTLSPDSLSRILSSKESKEIHSLLQPNK